MNTKEVTVWGIHAGRTGDADTVFMKKNVVALGWMEMGDLGALKPDRETFKAAVAKAYPNIKPGAVPVNAGQLFRFLYEVKPGDIMVYPSQHNRMINIARVEGPYQYAPDVSNGYPNMRPVKWLASLPRTAFTQGALYEIGSAMSLFQVRNYADEYLAALEGKPGPEISTGEDETVGYVVEAIELSTRDFILKSLGQQLKGHPLEHFVGDLLRTMGYRTRVTPEGADRGVDIIANKGEIGFEPPIIKVQIKSSADTVNEHAVSALYGKVSPGEYGLFVTLGTFQKSARTFEKEHSNLRLVDGYDLVELILQHYEQLDARYKGQIPLKRVYVPDEEAEE